jgi:transcriptional regulator with XRE-family HTH domain
VARSDTVAGGGAAAAAAGAAAVEEMGGEERASGAGRIGERIRELRLRRRWSQADLAAEAGVSRQYLGQIERGDRTAMGGELLDRIARALGFGNYHLMVEGREAGSWVSGPSPEIPVVEAGEEELLKVAIDADVSAGGGTGSRAEGFVYVDRREARGRALMAARVRGECMVPVLYPGDVVVCQRVWRQEDVPTGSLCVVTLLEEDEDAGGNVKYVDWLSGIARLRAEDKTERLVPRELVKVEGRVWRMIREF